MTFMLYVCFYFPFNSFISFLRCTKFALLPERQSIWRTILGNSSGISGFGGRQRFWCVVDNVKLRSTTLLVRQHAIWETSSLNTDHVVVMLCETAPGGRKLEQSHKTTTQKDWIRDSWTSDVASFPPRNQQTLHELRDFIFGAHKCLDAKYHNLCQWQMVIYPRSHPMARNNCSRSSEVSSSWNRKILFICTFLSIYKQQASTSISNFHLCNSCFSKLTVTQTNFIVNTNRAFDWVMGQFPEALPHGKRCKTLSWPMERMFCFWRHYMWWRWEKLKTDRWFEDGINLLLLRMSTQCQTIP